MLVGAGAVDVVRIQAAGGGSVTIESAGKARYQLHVIEDVTAVHVDVVWLVASDQVGTLAGARLELDLARVGCHCNLFSLCPHGKDESPGIQLPGGGQDKSGKLHLLEALRLDSDVVRARKQVGSDEFSLVRGLDLAGESVRRIDDGNGNAWDHGAAGVLYHSGDSPGSHLRSGLASQK